MQGIKIFNPSAGMPVGRQAGPPVSVATGVAPEKPAPVITDVLPEELLGVLGSQLAFQEMAGLASVSKPFQAAMKPVITEASVKQAFRLGIRGPRYLDDIRSGKRTALQIVQHFQELDPDGFDEACLGMLHLREYARAHLLIDNTVCQYLASGLLSRTEIEALSESQVKRLNRLSIQTAVDKGLITVPEALNLQMWELTAFEDRDIRKALESGQLSVRDLKGITSSNWAGYIDPTIQLLVASNQLTLRQSLHLESEEWNAMNHTPAR